MSASQSLTRVSKKSLGGRIAQVEGARFEQILYPWSHAIKATLTRIPNGCKTIRSRGRLQVIRIKSPFDFVITKQGIDLYQAKAAFFDAKSIQTGTFTYSLINQDQVHELDRIAKNGFSAGYLVHFRKLNKVVFFASSKLKALTKGHGLSPNDGIDVGSLSELRLDLIF